VQWMTAGSGIIHQEMPEGELDGEMWGLQLWTNLPARQKMMEPRYQEIGAAQIPEVSLAGGVKIKIICGELEGAKGPVRDIVTDPSYLDITIPIGATLSHRVKEDHTVFAYVLEGSGAFEPGGQTVESQSLILYSPDGESLKIRSEKNPVRFLLISGRPIREPVAWRGPIVMNTEEELRLAFDEYRQGTFLKTRSPRPSGSSPSRPS